MNKPDWVLYGVLALFLLMLALAAFGFLHLAEVTR